MMKHGGGGGGGGGHGGGHFGGSHHSSYSHHSSSYHSSSYSSSSDCDIVTAKDKCCCYTIMVAIAFAMVAAMTICWVLFGLSYTISPATSISGYNPQFAKALNTTQFPYMLILDYNDLLNGETANATGIYPQQPGYNFYTCTQESNNTQQPQFNSNYTSTTNTLNGTFTMFTTGKPNNSVNITNATANTNISVDGASNITCTSNCTNLQFTNNITFYSNNNNFTIQYWQFDINDYNVYDRHGDWAATCLNITGPQFADGYIMGLPIANSTPQPQKINILCQPFSQYSGCAWGGGILLFVSVIFVLITVCNIKESCSKSDCEQVCSCFKVAQAVVVQPVQNVAPQPAVAVAMAVQQPQLQMPIQVPQQMQEGPPVVTDVVGPPAM